VFVSAFLLNDKVEEVTMEYTIDYLEDKKFVQIKVKGRVNFQIAQQYLMEAIKLAHENNCRKFLISHTQTLLENGIYKIHTDGDALEKFGFKSSDKIAIVVSRSRDDLRFSEATDANAKWSNFKYFGTAREAVRWLAADR
jgi:hypothetical protein